VVPVGALEAAAPSGQAANTRWVVLVAPGDNDKQARGQGVPQHQEIPLSSMVS
jgi:hypothetical protein